MKLHFSENTQINDVTNSLSGQLYIGTGNKLKWQGQNVVTEDFIPSVINSNTKAIIKTLENIVDLRDNSKKVLLIIDKPNKNLNLSLRNLKNTNLLYSNTLNIKDLLVADKIVITTDALKNIQETYSD